MKAIPHLACYINEVSSYLCIDTVIQYIRDALALVSISDMVDWVLCIFSLDHKLFYVLGVSSLSSKASSTFSRQRSLVKWDLWLARFKFCEGKSVVLSVASCDKRISINSFWNSRCLWHIDSRKTGNPWCLGNRDTFSFPLIIDAKVLKGGLLYVGYLKLTHFHQKKSWESRNFALILVAVNAR